jgi:hypothetical protein
MEIHLKYQQSWDYFLQRGPGALGRVADLEWLQQTEPLFLLEILRSDMRVYVVSFFTSFCRLVLSVSVLQGAVHPRLVLDVGRRSGSHSSLVHLRPLSNRWLQAFPVRECSLST